jgi:hypothetical protein
MSENKTKLTEASVDSYLSAIEDADRQMDCRTLSALMEKVSGEPARMWGLSIVGFGSYHYKYASGREGDSCLVGFSSRKSEISLYLASDLAAKVDLLAKLGKYKTGKGCLYIHRMEDVDQTVLTELIREALAEHRSKKS